MSASILVVEDDPEIANILEYLLKYEGYKINLIADGQQAYDLVTKEPEGEETPVPDVVLLDIMLPHVDGIQICTAIRSTPRWKNVPVIMLTAKTQDISVSFATRAGADDYIIKPFSPQDVLTRIREAREKKASAE